MKPRQFIIVLTAANMIVSNLTRNCLYVAIVSMVNIKDQSRNSSVIGECGTTNGSSADYMKLRETSFHWSLIEVNMILGAYFYAYTAFQIPGGFVSVFFPEKHILNIFNTLHALITCFIPFAANYGSNSVILLRFLMGIAGACIFPANVALVKHLSLKNEVTISINLMIMFQGFGALISPILTGYVCSEEDIGGWRSSFYVCGIIQLLYSLFYIAISNTKEFKDILQINERSVTKDSTMLQSLKLFYDWKVYAYSYSQFAATSYEYLILLKLPQYYTSILNLPIFQNGLINSLPMIVYTLAPLISSVFISAMINNKVSSPRLLYSIFYTVSMFVALLMVSVFTQFIGCNRILATAIFCSILFCFLAANASVFSIVANHSKYVSLSTGISNSIGNSPGFIVPIYANIFTKNDLYSRANWQNVFYTTGLIGLSGVITFNLMLWVGKPNPYLLKQRNKAISN